MKTFLLYEGKKPSIKWGQVPDNYFFIGNLPENYGLAVCPSKGQVILDVDRHGNISGFDNIPENILKELNTTYHYPTKNNGKHYFFNYTGDKHLMNKTSGLGIDLRTNKGYVRYYPAEQGDDIRNHIKEIKETSLIMNEWLEKLFS